MLKAPWWPHQPPIYDINKTYLENAEDGPFFSAPIPLRPRFEPIDFLGFSIASPIGVPAGPLLNSRWISLASQLGYDVLCYKTIRSSAHAGHPLPNMVFVDHPGQFNPASLPPFVRHSPYAPSTHQEIAVTNSFGMPSRDPEYLARDIPLANSLLQPHQVMIVSVVGTPSAPGGFLEDCVRVAVQAKDYGAKIIEVNLSCPNVTTGEGSVHTHPETVHTIVSRICAAIDPIPLIIKVGVFPGDRALEECMIAAARGGARAISGINTISMQVTDDHGQPSLGIDRAVSGICGNPIRDAALDFTRQAYVINHRNRLGLTIMTTGGALVPEHFSQFLDAGADIAMSATGMMWDPYLALRYHYGVAHES